MLAYQERVVEEKRLLDEKIEKLQSFIGGNSFEAIDDRQKTILNIQLDIMRVYSRLLGERISCF